jgi:hypothetical protein
MVPASSLRLAKNLNTKKTFKLGDLVMIDNTPFYAENFGVNDESVVGLIIDIENPELPDNHILKACTVISCGITIKVHYDEMELV